MSRISKLVSNAVSNVGQTFVQPKLFIPVDCQVPETSKEIMARTMLSSGLITRDEYEKMLGVSYDVDVKDDKDEIYFDDDDFDDFAMSPFSGYEYDEEEPVPALDSVSTPEPIPTPEPVEPVNEPKES